MAFYNDVPDAPNLFSIGGPPLTTSSGSSMGGMMSMMGEGGGSGPSYDENGNLTSFTDADGNTTQWVYDDQDRVVEEIDPLEASRYYSYDEAGDLVRYTDRDGRVREYAYDDAHHVISETWYADAVDADAEEDPLNTISYEYDDAGRLLSESDANSTVEYAYDEAGGCSARCQK